MDEDGIGWYWMVLDGIGWYSLSVLACPGLPWSVLVWPLSWFCLVSDGRG